MNDWIYAIVRWIWYECWITFYWIQLTIGWKKEEPSMEVDLDSAKPQNWSGKGLLIVLPGFRQSIRRFKECRNAFARATKNVYTDVLSPAPIAYEGDQSMYSIASNYILLIRNYAIQYPKAPILIIGISAGGRLALYLEQLLRDVSNKIIVITIGSPLYGTNIIQWLPHSFLMKWCGKHFLDELDVDSKINIEMYKSIEKKPEHHEFIHFYSKQDWMSYPWKYCVTPHHKGIQIHRCPHSLLFMSDEVLHYLSIQFEK